jgi:hypothetical protein
LRIVEELLLDEQFTRETHVHHYAHSNAPYEKNIFRKVRHYVPQVKENEKSELYEAQTKTPYHPLRLTCKALSDAFSRIQQQQSLYVIHHHPFSRGVDDPGPYGPRRRVPLQEQEQMSRVKVVAEFNKHAHDTYYPYVLAMFSQYGPAYRAKFPRVKNIRFEIQIIDSRLSRIANPRNTQPKPTPIMNVYDLTLIIRSVLSSNYMEVRTGMLEKILLQFPSLAKLHIQWIRLPPAIERTLWEPDLNKSLSRMVEALRERYEAVTHEIAVLAR